MVWRGLFAREESLVSVDVGASSLKFVEFDLSRDKPRIRAAGCMPAKSESSRFSGNTISQTAAVAEQIDALLSEHGVVNTPIAIAMPAPSVFTKKIRMGRMPADQLATNIQFEAGNFIPHNIDAVKLDFHVLGAVGKDQLEVLVVAVKNEVIESYLDCFATVGREVAVVDVDYFAVQNIFETCAPQHVERTVALINIGERFSAINVCQRGQTLFTGDISVGGRDFTNVIAEAAGRSYSEAQALKETGNDPAVIRALAAQVEQAASEFNRQLSFFWSASGADHGIDRIFITGGGALTRGLREALQEKTGIECEVFSPFQGLEAEGGIDRAYLGAEGAPFCVAAGLALRRPGDKESFDYEEAA